MTSLDTLAVRLALPVSLLAYAVVALGFRHWWISGAVAPLVAWLLWRRHRRARFSSYVLLSVMAWRGLLTGSWGTLAYAMTAIGALQTPAALALWPRVNPRRWRRRRGVESRP